MLQARNTKDDEIQNAKNWFEVRFLFPELHTFMKKKSFLRTSSVIPSYFYEVQTINQHENISLQTEK